MAWGDKKDKKKKLKDQKLKKAKLVKIKYKKTVSIRASSFKDIVGLKLEQGVQFRIVTRMSFNAISVIQYLIGLYEIDYIYIVVFRINDKSFDFLKEIILGKDIKAGFIVSSFFNGNKKYERWAHELKDLSDNTEGIRASFYNSHAKVFLTKTKCGKHIVFEGSGNLSHNEKIEQYIYEDNKQAFYFHKEWIEDILNEGK